MVDGRDAAEGSRFSNLERAPLDLEPLRRALVGPGSRWTTVDVVESAGSTNGIAADWARANAGDGHVVVAEHQTAGRGRLDRTWTAPPRSALTVSAVVRPEGVDTARWPWLPLLTGLAVAAAVQRETGVAARLKWPNDVVVDDRKLAGILVERVETADHGAAAVIGIGLNVSMTRDELPVPTATSLALEGASTTDRSVVARAVLRALDSMVSRWEDAAGDPSDGLRAAYTAACSTIGRAVTVSLPDGARLEGDAIGIDESGRLVVDTADGQRALGAGDVLHTRPHP